MSTMSLFTVKQAAQRLGVSVRRVQKLCEADRLGQKVGNTYIIPEDELRKFSKIPRPAGRPKVDAE